MTAVYTLNLVDRNLIALLLQPIKEDLLLSDTQLGFVTGIAFGVFYAVLGIPLARWADRGNRVTIASSAIGLWGLTVMACLVVTNYTQLVCARIAAAVGEAGCKPPTYSLLGDYFPEAAQRTRAMSIYFAGAPLSVLVSFVIGGWLNELYGWRITFFLIGIPGLLLALLVRCTLVEPRTRLAASSAKDRLPFPISAVLATMWRQRASRHLTLALILLYTVTLGVGPWYAAFMIRSHGMSTEQLGILFGLIFSTSGIIGALGGGYAASRWFVGSETRQMRMSAISVALLTPFFLAFLLLPERNQALAALFPLIVVLNVYLGPTYALMQRLVPDEMRATMMATVMLLTNLIGFGIGPQIVGILSDMLRPALGEESLRYAMLTISFVALWSAYHFWQVGRSVKDDLRLVLAGA